MVTAYQGRVKTKFFVFSKAEGLLRPKRPDSLTGSVMIWGIIVLASLDHCQSDLRLFDKVVQQ